jgi:hypothetical protein
MNCSFGLGLLTLSAIRECIQGRMHLKCMGGARANNEDKGK